MDRQVVVQYVQSLDLRLQKIYELSTELQFSLADTLDDDFQIASEVNDIFRLFATRHNPQ